jgi:signal transduction histidine kinase
MSQALGVLKFVSHKEITNFNIGFNPFVSTREYYERLGRHNQIWNKLVFNVSKDSSFVSQLFEPLIDKDLMVKHLFKIYQKAIKYSKQDGIVFTRNDYYNDIKG